MKKYRLEFKIHVFSISVILILIGAYFVAGGIERNILSVFFLLASIFIFTYYVLSNFDYLVLSDDKLIAKRIRKEDTVIYFDEVRTICMTKGSEKSKMPVVASSKDRIVITPYVSDHKGIVREVIRKCKGNTNVSISGEVINYAGCEK